MTLTFHDPLQISLAAFVLIALLLQVFRIVLNNHRNPLRLPLPPGPKGYPIIGNLLDMPTEYPWHTYTAWSKVYGDIFSVKVLGQRVMVLNSLEAVQDLFEKRSATYSDRPRMPMITELMNLNFAFVLLPYGAWWRRQRRVFNENFHAGAVANYQPIQSKETRAFLNRLLDCPDMFVSHVRGTLASTLMNITYGIQITGLDDPHIRNAEECVSGFNIAGHPGAFLVDLIPVLKYMPNWMPGAGFKRWAAHYARVSQDAVEIPFDYVARGIKEGTARPSIATTLISTLPETDEKRRAENTVLAKNVSAVIYLAGEDTTFSSIQTFFLAMALYPNVQQKAQAELDAVVGPGRLPEFGDRPSLPYVNALIKETPRWQQVLPLAIPHRVTEDDVYRGYFIPKGTIVIGNARAILHDEKVFKNPQEFNPDRYLKDGQLDPTVRQPEVAAFGFGRRICPGRHFADNSMFMLMASTLHTFNITAGLDSAGEPEPLSAKMTGGVLSYPEPFSIEIRPKSDDMEKLVRSSILGDL